MARLPPKVAVVWLVLLVIALLSVPAGAAGKEGDEEEIHKPLWPLNTRDYLTYIFGAFGLVLASAGGLGGGGVLMPLYLLVAGFPMKYAVVLSNLTVLGGATANVLIGSFNRHPQRDRPIIGWDLIITLEPVAICGSVLGAFVHRVLPPLISTIILVVVLGYMGYRAMSRGLRLVQDEGGWRQVFAVGKGGQGSSSLPQNVKPNSVNGSHNTERRNLLEGNPASSSSKYTDGATAMDQDAVQRIIDSERTTPWWKPAFIAVVFIGVSLFTIGKKYVQCGTPLFWVLGLAPIAWVLPFFFSARNVVLKDYQLKQSVGYQFAKGDVHWNPQNTLKWPLSMILAGLMASMFGIGGGMVKGPLMLEMNVLPAVASATVAVMIFLTSASASVAFLAFGEVIPDYGLFGFVFGFVCTMFGVRLVSSVLKAKGKQSPVVLSIGAFISLSTVMMGFQAVTRMLASPGSALQFGSVCRSALSGA